MICLDDSVLATRTCLSDDILGASWDHPLYTDCGDKVELNLDKLANVSIMSRVTTLIDY